MQLVLSKHKDNITSIIRWLILSKMDVHTSSPIHPHIQVQYKIVHSSQEITNIFANQTT